MLEVFKRIIKKQIIQIMVLQPRKEIVVVYTIAVEHG